MAGTTTNLALRYPGSTDPDNVSGDLNNLATDVDTVLSRQGLLSARPAAGHKGALYYATDTDMVSRDDGTAWHDFPSKAVTDAAYGVGAWSAYTPTTSGLTLGNGTIVGNYRQVGKTLNLRIALTWGSTSVAGTTDWRIGLPASLTPRGPQVGTALYAKVSGVAYRGVTYLQDSTATFAAYFADGQFDAAAYLPVAPAAGDTFLFTATLETN